MLKRLILIDGPSSSSDGRSIRGTPLLSPSDRAALSREFPGVEVESGAPGPSGGALHAVVDARAWRASALDLWALDTRLHALDAGGLFDLRIEGLERAGAARAAHEVLTRCQRFLRRRNLASATEVFDRVLARHRELHDLDRPLVRADHDHAIDVWQWMLRLEPRAGVAVQVAALFHDVERLVSEADVRREHRAPDYQAFKDEHARRGAALTRAALTGVGLAQEVIDRIGALVASHERPGDDAELALLNDADALSFFSLNSAGFLDCYGAEHTRAKVAYTLRRLRPEARALLPRIRCRPEVEAMIPGEPGRPPALAPETQASRRSAPP
ncbi:hypothetical protein predicted by Glimmer/Critica [Sorangium cellulosum So ce56]|uniref:DUF4202 domain-containing protein n=1 Tax=Sorangium cellulosum (strain So ce56) TaxID=448385 RepID=A9GTM5_SORC5|nr:DUF4202 family protein [Sorangium cellulosum]CAN96965.1 hypothetical protein predicted by Glimmer/Critica [Sorangium cellulosum So ce56]